MSLVSPSQAAAGEEITAAKINDPVNQLATGINNINDAQIVDVSGTKLTDATVTAAKMATAANPETRFSDSFFDHVASGCVWSGDAYGSTLAASMTSGVVFINGKRVTVSAVTAHTFTASKDTYVDVNDSGVVSYAEVANNAASQPLAANSIRLAIIVSGATNIANSGSVNQGQETKVLPIASSVPYAVTDSLGNLICPRDPNRRVLGQRQITSNATYTTLQQITGLSVPISIPTGRKIRCTFMYNSIYSSSASAQVKVSIWDGGVSSGTQLQEGIIATAASNQQFTGSISTPAVTLSAGSHTINVGALSTVGTGSLTANTTLPAVLIVELV